MVTYGGHVLPPCSHPPTPSGRTAAANIIIMLVEPTPLWPTQSRDPRRAILVVPARASHIRAPEGLRRIRGPLFVGPTRDGASCRPITLQLAAGVGDIDALSISELRRIIVDAGLSTTDCLEKADVRQRAREALALAGGGGGSSLALEPHWQHVPDGAEADAELSYAAFTAAADWVHAACEADEAALLADCGRGWAHIAAAAYAIRWLGAPASVAVERAGGVLDPRLRSQLLSYCPLLFSISLFDTQSGSETFRYYARGCVSFVLEKAAVFGGCEFKVHLNERAAEHTALLERLHEAAHGRIAFEVVCFEPRPRVAPWLLAAMRLVPLLECSGRIVATMDVGAAPADS